MLFGTDGIRGTAYNEISTTLMYDIGRACGIFNIKNVIVGMDTRQSSPDFKNALIKGLNEANLYIHDLNIVPTPLIINLSESYKTLGIIITASHNKYNDNGIKIVKYGKKISKSDIDLLEYSINKTIRCVNNDKLLNISLYPYQEKLLNFKIKKDLKVVFDCANGSFSYFIKNIVNNYNFKYTIINDKPDGKNINDDCGSMHLDNIKNVVNKLNYDIGFAFDGDGDRLIAVDNNFNTFDGDSLIYLFAKNAKLKDKSFDGVVLNKDINPGVLESYDNLNIKYLLTDIGDSNIYNTMEKNHYILGGETSGHIINKNYSNTGDGLLNSLLILEILSLNNKTIKEMINGIKFYPILRYNLDNFNESIIDSIEFKDFIKSEKEKFNDLNNLILVRRSGTEHLLRITVSSSDSKLNETILNDIINMVKK